LLFAAAQQPEVTDPCDWRCRNIWNFVLVGEPRGTFLLGQLARQFLVIETEDIQVEIRLS
jgi:hypothetical protein